MLVNNVELEDLDFMDADVAEKYEFACENVVKDMAEISNKKGLKDSQLIRLECESVFRFFDSVFGEGTHKKIFGDKVNLMVCIKAFEDVKNYQSDKDKEFADYAANLKSKYSPNRAQRRASK